MIIPAIGEDAENVQIVADCFRVGPMVDDGTRIGGNVYVVAVPGATQEVTCSTDGRDAAELTHNHVFAVGPGDAEYNGHFQINLVVPGPNYLGEEDGFGGRRSGRVDDRQRQRRAGGLVGSASVIWLAA